MTLPALHPDAAGVVVPAAMLAAIVDQALAEAPLEACGLIVGTAPLAAGGRPLRYEPCRNELASRSRFSVHPDDLYRVTIAADDAGEVVWGIVHSHPHSPAVPSATDTGLALYPDAVHLLVTFVAGAPEVRAWRIADGAATELPLAIGAQ
jgi:[CysO sulfur-carrier protein]-S-L-cysteine hydrolase